MENITRDISALKEGYLWFSRIKDFNDPFEGEYLNRFIFRQPSEIKDKECALLWQDVPDIQKIENNYDRKLLVMRSIESSFLTTFSEFVDESRICCFNQDGAVNAINNKLMWGHYGNGLRGMVLEFEAGELVNSINSLNNQLIQWGEIDYFSSNKVDALTLLTNCKNDPKNGLHTVLLKKCKEWFYENELRLISKNLQRTAYSHKCIKSITIGQKMGKDNREEILAILGALKLTEKLQVATICKETFNIKIKSYDGSLFYQDEMIL